MKEEIWQVEANGQIYETDLKTLKQWIAERAVLPTDKVRVGEKKFVQARLVPQLASCFTTVQKPEKVNVAPVTTNAVSEVDAITAKINGILKETKIEKQTQVGQGVTQRRNEQQRKFSNAEETVCVNHPEEAAHSVCRACYAMFCKACPKTYGSVKICPNCGDMCEEIKVAQTQGQKNARRQNYTGTVEFGASDYGQSWSYPFKFVSSLLFGALFIAVLSLAGFIGSLLANMIVFGCISQTINQISQGNYDRNFMPDFDDFSIWDDVLKPFLLSIGISLVSWLPAVLAMMLMFYVIASNIATNISMMPTDEIGFSPSSEKADEYAKQKFESTAQADGEEGTFNREEFERKFEEMKNSPKTSGLGNDFGNAGNGDFMSQTLFTGFQSALKNALPFALLCLLAIGWGLFYSPIALAVAGYTRSLRATINPLVGLDTIKRIGFGTYFKALLMILSVQLVSFVIAFIVGVITSPLTLPLIGNLPANFLLGAISFYFSLVTSSILGLMLQNG